MADRDTIRCVHCKLNQYATVSGLCRRCKQNPNIPVHPKPEIVATKPEPVVIDNKYFPLPCAGLTRALLVTAALSFKEKEVASCLLLGLSNTEIARQLDCSRREVKSHLSRMYMRFQIPNHLNQRIVLAVMLYGYSDKR